MESRVSGFRAQGGLGRTLKWGQGTGDRRQHVFGGSHAGLLGRAQGWRLLGSGLRVGLFRS